MSEEKTIEAREVASAVVATSLEKSIQRKDLLVPGAIIIAGICIGAGLYFGTGGATQPVANKQTAPAAEKVDTTNKINPVTEADHIKGNLNAPVKIVEYSDFECPFCKKNHETLRGVVEKLGPEKVAWVYRQFPLEQLHPVKAMSVAMASECIASLGGNTAFWKFADRYFEETLTNNRTDIDTLIPTLVAETGVNKQSFTSCFEGKEYAAAIEEDITDAVETGGQGTPWSIIIGPTGKTYPVNGALPAQTVEQMIELAIREA